MNRTVTMHRNPTVESLGPDDKEEFFITNNSTSFKSIHLLFCVTNTSAPPHLPLYLNAFPHVGFSITRLLARPPDPVLSGFCFNRKEYGISLVFLSVGCFCTCSFNSCFLFAFHQTPFLPQLPSLRGPATLQWLKYLIFPCFLFLFAEIKALADARNSVFFFGSSAS